MPAWTFALVFCCVLLGRPASADSASEELRQAARDLGSRDSRTRRQASRTLWEAGPPAREVLEDAARSSDAEVAARAERLLDRMRWGIYADTPIETVELILKFRYGDAESRHETLLGLARNGEVETVLRLLDAEPDEPLRARLMLAVTRESADVVGPLLMDGKFEQAEQLLRLPAPLGNRAARNFAAFHLLRRTLDDEIRRQRPAGNAPAGDAKHLPYLLRVSGDLDAARRAAEAVGEHWLVRDILSAQENWSALAEAQRPPRGHNDVADPDLEHLARVATYYGMAGNRDEQDDALAELVRLAATGNELAQRTEVRSHDGWYAVRVLMMNDRWDAARTMLDGFDGGQRFEILIAQGRIEEALDLVGLDPAGDVRQWFAGLAPKEPGLELAMDRIETAIAAARLMARLGHPEQAADLLSLAAKRPGAVDVAILGRICELEMALGRTERVLSRAAQAIERESDLADTLMPALFGERAAAARPLWRFLGQTRGEEPVRARLERLWNLLSPSTPGGPGAVDEDLVECEQHVLKLLQTVRSPETGRLLHSLAEQLNRCGQTERAREYARTAATMIRDPHSLLRYADLLADDGQWAEAADFYGRAHESELARRTTHSREPGIDPHLALWLRGHALEQAGRADEGHRMRETASLIPLADLRARHALADGLRDRGFIEEAARQWELILQIGPADEWAAAMAAKELGNLAVGHDDLRAAALWARLLVFCLDRGATFAESANYVQLPNLIHRLRARGLVAAGRSDEALEEIELALAAIPGDARLATELVPALENAGRLEDAEALFRRVHDQLAGLCERYPASAEFHNDLAWTAARCRRELDAALWHAEIAVRLKPDDPAYLDTLAEVHFQRGDRHRAVELARRCLELDPDHPHLQEQLQRFEQSEPGETQP